MLVLIQESCITRTERLPPLPPLLLIKLQADFKTEQKINVTNSPGGIPMNARKLRWSHAVRFESNRISRIFSTKSGEGQHKEKLRPEQSMNHQHRDGTQAEVVLEESGEKNKVVAASVDNSVSLDVAGKKIFKLSC
uniref:PPUP9376 n=1 Tax=Poeciliopsis prolifica TaxID=188132 RepID=A0A0S7ES51_9TELE